jgi:hypothetical protein
MKYSLLLICAIFALSLTARAEHEVEHLDLFPIGYQFTAEMMDKMIARYATGTKAYQMKRTLYCESGYKNIQSYIVKNDQREDSWGIAQIHLPSHPSVSREQALDPEFSIKFMNDNWELVRWYGYERKKDRCNQ